MMPLAEAARYLNLTPWQLRSLIYARKITYSKSGNGNYKQQRVFFKREDLDKYQPKMKLIKAMSI